MRAALLLVLLAAEPPGPVPSAVPSTAPEPPAPRAAPAPPPAAPATTILKAAAAIEPAQRVPLAPGAEVVIDPRATFEVELAARLPDARLVLVDGRDDLVAATSERELSALTRLTLSPSAPLVPGSRYALRVDGAATRDVHDDAGHAYAPLTFPLLVAGTPPPPEQSRPARPKKRRR